MNARLGDFPTLRGAKRQPEFGQPAGVCNIDKAHLAALVFFVKISQGLEGAVVEGRTGHG